MRSESTLRPHREAWRSPAAGTWRLALRPLVRCPGRPSPVVGLLLPPPLAAHALESSLASASPPPVPEVWCSPVRYQNSVHDRAACLRCKHIPEAGGYCERCAGMMHWKCDTLSRMVCLTRVARQVPVSNGAAPCTGCRLRCDTHVSGSKSRGAWLPVCVRRRPESLEVQGGIYRACISR